MWICTMGHAARRTGAAESAVVALQKTEDVFHSLLVLVYSIYYDFQTKPFLDYCLQTGTWLCRYLTNYSLILSFNHCVPQSTCTPNRASGIQYFSQKSLKLIIPGLHNISWSPNSLFSIFAIVIFHTVSQTLNTYIKLNSCGNCFFRDTAKYRIYCTQTRKLALIWAFRDPDRKIFAQTSGIYLETQHWTQSVLSDQLSLMYFRIGFIH